MLGVGKSRGSKPGSKLADALEQGRVRGEPAAERSSAVLEQHVRDFLGVDRHDARRITADLLQGTGEPFGLPRELHGGRVGETLALPRHACLDEPREKYADAADDHECETDREGCRDAAAVAAAPAAARVAHAAQQPASRERQHEDAEREADQLLVQAHIAVQDVTELVRDDALQLGALEMLEGAARHGDRGIRARETGRKRVDARLLLEDVDRGHGQPRRERHLLDHIDEPPLERIVTFAGDERAAEHLCDVTAAACERSGAIQAGDDHQPERAQGKQQYQPAVAADPLLPTFGAEEQRVVLGVHAEGRRHHDRRRERDDKEREQKRHDERAARAARLLLAREEVHGGEAARG